MTASLIFIDDHLTPAEAIAIVALSKDIIMKTSNICWFVTENYALFKRGLSRIPGLKHMTYDVTPMVDTETEMSKGFSVVYRVSNEGVLPYNQVA